MDIMYAAVDSRKVKCTTATSPPNISLCRFALVKSRVKNVERRLDHALNAVLVSCALLACQVKGCSRKS